MTYIKQLIAINPVTIELTSNTLQNSNQEDPELAFPNEFAFSVIEKFLVDLVPYLSSGTEQKVVRFIAMLPCF